jgi:hypothetical protein
LIRGTTRKDGMSESPEKKGGTKRENEIRGRRRSREKKEKKRQAVLQTHHLRLEMQLRARAGNPSASN